jgi:hypothetical protein
VVEGARLESGCSVTGTVSSNLILSAIAKTPPSGGFLVMAGRMADRELAVRQNASGILREERSSEAEGQKHAPACFCNLILSGVYCIENIAFC